MKIFTDYRVWSTWKNSAFPIHLTLQMQVFVRVLIHIQIQVIMIP